jgi:hypothetical protein
MTELSGRKNVVGPFFKISYLNVVSRRDNVAFVDSTNKLNNNLFTSMIINDLELSNIVVFLHDSQEFKENL